MTLNYHLATTSVTIWQSRWSLVSTVPSASTLHCHRINKVKKSKQVGLLSNTKDGEGLSLENTKTNYFAIILFRSKL
jgi:hypothetical protein